MIQSPYYTWQATGDLAGHALGPDRELSEKKDSEPANDGRRASEEKQAS